MRDLDPRSDSFLAPGSGQQAVVLCRNGSEGEGLPRRSLRGRDGGLLQGDLISTPLSYAHTHRHAYTYEFGY